ncbi:MAG: PD40 domain-containing protein [Gemmatimonadota bacterium]|nr:MAG: PD40 domain-containing protein [Gemmatimonadota bacterium]
MNSRSTRTGIWICPLALLLTAAACREGGVLPASARAAGADGRPVAAADTAPVLRRLWEGTEPDFWSAAVSPDGRYVSEIDWSTGDLALLDLVDGQVRRLTDKGPWDQVVAWAETSSFSPDGRRLAYTYWSDERWGYEIRVIDTDGSNESVVLPHPDEIAWIHVHDWTPDGQRLLATLYLTPPNEQGFLMERVQLSLVDIRTGETEALQLITPRGVWEGPQRAELSPDGRFAVFDLVLGEGPDAHRDVFAAALDGSGDWQLVTGPQNDRFMGWAPDGRSILFHSDRGLSEGIWRLPVREGRPAGPPQLVRSNVWQLSPIGSAKDGKYYFGVTTQRPQIHTASIDIDGGRLLTSPAAVSDRMEVSSNRAVWSPDGQYLAYLLETDVRVSQSKIVVRPVSGGDGREIDVPLSKLHDLLWLADSRSVLLVAEVPLAGGRGLYRYDLEGGSLEMLAAPADLRIPMLGGSRDARIFYRWDWDADTGVSTLYAWDLETKRDRTIATMPGLTWQPTPSPDGGQVAFVHSDPETGANRLMILPAAGGSAAPIEVTGGYGRLGSLANIAWSPDGRFLLVRGQDDERQVAVLWRIPVSGGQPLKLLEQPAGMGLRGLRLNATGDRIAFNSGELRGEVWVMEGLR